jgi:hypothetical protein
MKQPSSTTLSRLNAISLKMQDTMLFLHGITLLGIQVLKERDTYANVTTYQEYESWKPNNSTSSKTVACVVKLKVQETALPEQYPDLK